METDERDGVDKEVISRLQGKYGQETQDLFWWLWSGLRRRCPSIWCRAWKRYVGFYVSEYTDDVVAYLNFKASGIHIGVHQSVYDAAKPEIISCHHFPRWSGPRQEFGGFYLDEREPEIIEFLVQAYRATSEGLYAVTELRTKEKRKQRKLEDTVRGDLAAIKDEEALPEGREKERYSTYAERNPKLRTAAIQHHGTDCKVCGFSFRKFYGWRNWSGFHRGASHLPNARCEGDQAR